jgi:hypothetical protein
MFSSYPHKEKLLEPLHNNIMITILHSPPKHVKNIDILPKRHLSFQLHFPMSQHFKLEIRHAIHIDINHLATL